MIEYTDNVNSEVEEEDFGVIDNPFNPSRIDIDTKQPTVSNVVDRIRHNELNLRPDFQRMGDLWSTQRQSRLIESLLLRIPLPAFYFDVETVRGTDGLIYVKWNVIDGLQRLCTIRNFMLADPSDERFLRLTGMEFLTQYEGRAFFELPRPYQRIIEETQLTAYLIKPGTPSNVKFNIFRRVNTGGVPLNQQEVRHALNQGVAADFLKELAETDSFRNATQSKLSPKRMQDREFVNRFLAFYLQETEAYQDMDSFMNDALKIVSSMPIDARLQVKRSFCETLDVLYYLLGDNAFRRMDLNGAPKINKALFEVFTVCVAKLSQQDRLRLREATNVKRRYSELLGPGSELAQLISTSTGQRSRVRGRYDVVNRFISSLINEEGI